MMLTLNTIAEVWLARMMLCLIEGSAIAVFGWLLLRAFPHLSASARFGFWLATLLAIAALPFQLKSQMTASSTAHSWLTLPSTWAVYIVTAWAVIAAISFGRVMLGLLQLRALRKDCILMDHETLPSGVGKA